MQFDHVLLYMAFGSLIALGGFVLAIWAKSGDGHGSVSFLGMSISLQAAGGILVVAIGALIFLMPMLMGRDLNQQVQIDRLKAELTDMASKKASSDGELAKMRDENKGKVKIQELAFASIFMPYPAAEPTSSCAEKISGRYEVAEKGYLKDGWLVAHYVDGAAYIRCGSQIAVVVASADGGDASNIVDAVVDVVRSIYPDGGSEPAQPEIANGSTDL